MAERFLTHAVGDALVALIDWTWPRFGPSAKRVLSSVAEAVRPESPVTLVSVDGGEVLTGIALMHRGQVLAFFGTRHSSAVVAAQHQPLRGRGDEHYWR